MRHILRALLSVLLLFGTCRLAPAQSSSWRIWPFGTNEEPLPTAARPTTTPPPITEQRAPALPPSAAITPIESGTPQPQATPGLQTSSGSASAPVLPQTAQDSDRPPIIESPFANLSWPKMPTWRMSKPQSPQLRPSQPEVEVPRNAWVEQPPAPPKPSPLQSVKNGAHRVASSTRNAWRKAVEKVYPGDEDHRTGSRVASREVRPPFWQRMRGSEKSEKEGQTISEFVGQPRP